MQIFNLNQYLRAILESSKGYDFGFFGFLLKLLYNVVLVSLVQQSESVICTYTPSYSDSFPIKVFTEHWVELPVLYSRALLVVCFIHRRVCPTVEIRL